MAYGSDLVKDPERQSDEFRIRSVVQSPLEVIRSATLAGAKVLRRQGTLGVIAEGASADLLAVQGDPTVDITLLTEQGRHLSLIMKDGFVKKDALGDDLDRYWLENGARRSSRSHHIDLRLAQTRFGLPGRPKVNIRQKAPRLAPRRSRESPCRITFR